MEAAPPKRESPPPSAPPIYVDAEEIARFLLEATEDCVLFLNTDGKVLLLNQQARQALTDRVAQPIGEKWELLLPLASQSAARSAFEQARAGTPADVQLYTLAADGTPQWWRVSIKALCGPNGNTHRCFVLMRNITAHLLALRAMRQSEEGFRRIFEENPIGMVLANYDCQISRVNNALCGMLGFSANEFERVDLRTIGGDKSALRAGIQRLINGECDSVQLEVQLLTKVGRVVWANVTTSLIYDSDRNPLCFLQMVENISQRKKADEQLLAYQEQLQTLAAELSLGEERERRRIATGLHDRIGQTLALARLTLGRFGSSPTGAQDGIKEVRELIEQAITDTRSLTFELSPPVLYELGLVPALEWLARKIQQDHSIPTRFHDDGQPKPLDEKFRVVLFQAVRELLFNVVKHAAASHAQVMTRRDADALRIIIEDDGKGFAPNSNSPLDRMKAFGLFNIRERLEYLGGHMKIRSEPGLGTRITLMAPLQLENKHHGHSNSTR